MAIWNGTFTPRSVGPAGGVWRVPYVDGVSKTFDLDRATFRVETAPIADSASYSVKIQKSNGGGAFSATDIVTLTIAAAAFENAVTTALGTIDSGQLLRVNWTALGVGAETFEIQLEGTEQ